MRCHNNCTHATTTKVSKTRAHYSHISNFAQSLQATTKRVSDTVQMKWQSAGMATLLLLTCCETAQLRLGIFPEQNAEGDAGHRTGRHDLLAFAHGLEKMGHAVTIINQVAEERIHDSLASGPASKDALFDAVLTQGEPHLAAIMTGTILGTCISGSC